MRTLMAGYGFAGFCAWAITIPQGGWLAGLLTFWIGGAIATLALSAVTAWVMASTAEPVGVRADDDPDLRLWDEDARLERLEAELYLERIHGRGPRTVSSRHSA